MLLTLIVQSRLIGLIHVAGLVLALAMRSTHPRTQVTPHPPLSPLLPLCAKFNA